MKPNLSVLILILLINLNCQNTNVKSEGYWIGIYSVLDKSPHIEDKALLEIFEELHDDTVQLKNLLLLKEDSMTLTHFNETLYYGFAENSIKYNFGKDSLNFFDKEGKFMIIDFRGPERVKYKDYYTQLEEFGMSHKQKEISSFLTNTPIILGQRIDKIELASPHWHHMGKFIQDSIEANYGSGNDWYFCSLEKELFLVIGDNVIQVSKFDNEKLYGFTFDREVSKIEIKKSIYNQKFDIKFLIGNWVENKNSKNIEQLKERQQIEIRDKKIIVSSKTYSDTLQWRLNRYNNKILLENDYLGKHGSYWKIENLSKNEFVVKRKIMKNNESEIEILTLIKK